MQVAADALQGQISGLEKETGQLRPGTRHHHNLAGAHESALPKPSQVQAAGVGAAAVATQVRFLSVSVSANHVGLAGVLVGKSNGRMVEAQGNALPKPAQVQAAGMGPAAGATQVRQSLQLFWFMSGMGSLV